MASALPAGPLADSVATRLSDLIGYQSVHYASDYLRHVVEVFTSRRGRWGRGTTASPTCTPDRYIV